MNKRKYLSIRNVILLGLVAVCLFGLVYAYTRSLNRSLDAQNLETTERAIHRAMITCYSLEGVYPPSIEYLESNYGVVIDHDKYIVDYSAFSTGVMPVVVLIPKKG